MAEAVKPRSSTKPAKLPDMTGWSAVQIAEFWETHDSTDYLDQMEDVEVQQTGQKCVRVAGLATGTSPSRAELITQNGREFEAIRKLKPFSLLVVPA